MSERRIKVVAAIIIKDGKVFVTRRGYGPWKDWWEFSGGKMEAGETPQMRGSSDVWRTKSDFGC